MIGTDNLINMALLSFFKDERVVLLGLGVTLFTTVASIWTILEHYRDAVEIKPQPPKPQYITQATEDSLDQSTLQSLTSHYNYSIREIALKIVAGRAANSSVTVSHLLRGITRSSYDERFKCLKALCLLVEDQRTYQPQKQSLVCPPLVPRDTNGSGCEQMRTTIPLAPSNPKADSMPSCAPSKSASPTPNPASSTTLFTTNIICATYVSGAAYNCLPC